ARLDVFEVSPALRYRSPLWQGRLVPFLMGGVGVSNLDTNEQRPTSEFRDGRQVIVVPNFRPDSPAIVGMIGAGVEYFLNHHLSIGLTVPLHIYSSVDTQLVRTGHKTMTGSADPTGGDPCFQLKGYRPRPRRARAGGWEGRSPAPPDGDARVPEDPLCTSPDASS